MALIYTYPFYLYRYDHSLTEPPRPRYTCVSLLASGTLGGVLHPHLFRGSEQATRFKHQDQTVPSPPYRVQQIEKISNQTLSKALLADLFQENDGKRNLKSIDTTSAQQIFAIFNLKAPQCDKDRNGAIEGRELKCFNKIWKYFIPDDEYW